MHDTKLKIEPVTARHDRPENVPRPSSAPADQTGRRLFLPTLTTLVTVAVAAVLTWQMWRTYMGQPWTRDGTVRAYVVTMAPEVAGKVIELAVRDNQLVHKGDLLMVIDPIDYTLAVERSEAAVVQAKATAENAQVESDRRQKLTTLAVSEEMKQTYAAQALSARAAYQQAVAMRDRAKVDLERTRIVSPVNGYVTNLQVQLGDYINVGQRTISIVNTDSFWIDGYFEENLLGRVHEGDPASIKLMGYKQLIRAHVESVARGINVANAQPDSTGLATVNPIFTWVRLAQRVPVRIHIDEVPPGVRLVVGLTATVQIHAASEPADK